MHSCQLRVRTYECDNYGHVNNATYLNYLEYARLELLRAENIDYLGMIKDGFGIFIAEVNIQYLKGALADDILTITTTPVDSGGAFGVVQQEIWRGEELITRAKVKWVSVDSQGRPRRIPPQIKNSRFMIP